MPAYLEEENLRLLLPRLHQVLDRIGEPYEILVVDTPKPKDATAAVCAAYGARYLPRTGGESYGYEIIQEASRRSEKSFQFKEGTLYPALHQLYKRGYLRSEWRLGTNGRQRKYYSITAKGRKVARAGQRGWQLFTKAVDAVLLSNG